MISSLNSGNRIYGLSSGLETDTLITRLTAGTRSKIEGAGQQKQLLEWRQESYRETLGRLTAFSKKYFSAGSQSFAESLNKFKVESAAPQYVTATASSNSAAGSIIIGEIKSLATSARLRGEGSVSAPLTGDLSGADLSALQGASFDISLDGVRKTVTLKDGDFSSTADVATALREGIDNAFGGGRITVTEDGDTVTLGAQSSHLRLFATPDGAADALPVLGFSHGASNRINLSDRVSDIAFSRGLAEGDLAFTINGKEFSYHRDVSLYTIMSDINSSGAGVTISYSSVSDQFTVVSKTTGNGSDIEFSDTSDAKLLTALLGVGEKTKGTDAELSVGLSGESDPSRFVNIKRNSNTFDIDGLFVTLKQSTNGSEVKNISLTTAHDIDAMVSSMTGFVEEYNSLIEFMDKKVSEPYYRGFLPLTDDQKKELNEEDRKLWTEKSKSGLLRNDPTLATITSAMRSSMYSSVSKIGEEGKLTYMLPDIGITTGYYSEKGKLNINEETLRAALSKDMDGVLSLFIQKSSVSYSQYNADEAKKTRYNESGLLYRIQDIVQNNISWIGKKGPLVELVGSPENNYTGQTLYKKKLEQLEASIDRLSYRLELEEQRYLKQFSSLESALNGLNHQSSWLTQQFSSK